MFLEMRRHAFESGAANYPEHRGLQNYEAKGTSQRFSWYALPEGCDTIFFPGCSLPGTRPQQTLKAFEVVQKQVPNAGIVLDCCTKPSHDLGKDDYFHAMFGEMKDFLLANGIKNVLVACPNCDKVFTQYGNEFNVSSIYQLLNNADLPATAAVSGVTTIHDPCVSRFSEPVQDSVRDLVQKTGLDIVETKHSRSTTLCCGEGGAVGCLAPDLAQSWTQKRNTEAAGLRTVTYCAGCAHFLGAHGPTNHILDLVFTPEDAVNNRAKVSKAPMTYLNRLSVKKILKKTVPAAVTRERTFTADASSSGGLLKKIALLALFVAAIVAVRSTGATEYLEEEKLRGLIEGYGVLAPLIYMALYCIAPTLFLPGLPLSIVGAVLFGPVWGVVYTLSSASVGACIAFLVSRYLARDWIEGKLKSPRWRHLDDQVEKHGWKMVAFTRLIPLFPFNLLNYAFGLTRVRFSHYALATLVFMLPGTVAFITFSSSLLDVLRGRISATFLIGLGLMVLVSLFPLIYRRYRNRRNQQPQPAQPSTPKAYSVKRSVQIKTLTFVLCAAIVGLGLWLSNHYFWAINAHVYTAEFHLLFLLKNLKAANLEMMVEYFTPMGISLSAFLLVLSAHFIQGFYLPLTEPILVSAQVNALGLPLGLLFSYLSLLLTGLVAFGLARFLLGDLRPVLRGKLHPPGKGKSRLLTIGLPLLAAVPWLPLPLMSVIAGALRVPLRTTALQMSCGLLLRVIFLTLLPTFFI